MCSASKAGSYSRLIYFVYHPTLVLRVIAKKKKVAPFHFVEGLGLRIEPEERYAKKLAVD